MHISGARARNNDQHLRDFDDDAKILEDHVIELLRIVHESGNNASGCCRSFLASLLLSAGLRRPDVQGSVFSFRTRLISMLNLYVHLHAETLCRN